MSRAHVDLNFPQVTARVFSREMAMEPVPSARYGIDVTGCGKEAMYTVTCQEFGERQGVHHLGGGRAINTGAAEDAL